MHVATRELGSERWCVRRHLMPPAVPVPLPIYTSVVAAYGHSRRLQYDRLQTHPHVVKPGIGLQCLDQAQAVAVQFIGGGLSQGAKGLRRHPNPLLKRSSQWRGRLFLQSPSPLLRRRTSHGGGRRWVNLPVVEVRLDGGGAVRAMKARLCSALEICAYSSPFVAIHSASSTESILVRISSMVGIRGWWRTRGAADAKGEKSCVEVYECLYHGVKDGWRYGRLEPTAGSTAVHCTGGLIHERIRQLRILCKWAEIGTTYMASGRPSARL